MKAVQVRAAVACREYEHWASEVARLTQAISAEECPHEAPCEAESHFPGFKSCFSEAAAEHTDAGYPDSAVPDNPATRPKNLDEIEEEVRGCESCMRLIGLIRERKEARKRYGIAKRAVRVVGKTIITAEVPT